jgi:4-hydroxy-3-polyprenylbenzoate decarboxylase
MAYRDLRKWIKKLESEEELARVGEKVDWDLEIGGITQETFDRKGPALLFENIKDHEATFCTKLFAGSIASYSRVAMMLGVPKDTQQPDLIKIWRERSKKPIKPVIVDSGLCKKNILKGDDVDLFQFPVPKWHDRDGGRYIGTFDGVVTKDIETGWMNVGLYRQMIHDRNNTGISIAMGQHIWTHWKKEGKGGRMPVAVAIGWDPILPAVAGASFPRHVCEYDIMGALRQEPVELVKCETSDLYVPAACEIVLEGEVSTDPSSFRDEGPFGEYTGHYSSKASPQPVFHVNCITFRDDPIYQGTLEGMPINEEHILCSIVHSAAVWDLLDERMVGKTTAVNVDASTGWANVFVQIDNSYYGQVHQVAANVWSWEKSTGIGKNIIVVDEDVDVYDLTKVLWAIAYRVRPSQDIIVYPGWVIRLDPVIHPRDKTYPGPYKGERLLVDATKPFDNPEAEDWFGLNFPPLAYPDRGTMAKVRAKWHKYGIEC